MASHAENNYDFLRFFAASLVIFSHCYPLTGQREFLAAWIADVSFGDLAVRIFFIISGYLVTASMAHSRSAAQYLWKRSLRIFPAFAVSIAFCGLIIGPWMTTLPLNDYFSDPMFREFMGNINLYSMQGGLPGLFADHPNKAVNGVYWSLPIEFTLYLAVAALYLARSLRPLGAAALAMGFFAWNQHLPLPPDKPMMGMSPYLLSFYATQFMLGAWMYLARDRLPLDWRVALLLAALCYACRGTPAEYLILSLCLPYIVIWLAHRPLPVIKDWGRYGDFSYGIYLYGFPMQQMLVHSFGTGIPIALLCGLAWAGALICAALSWHLVEKRTLALKQFL